MTPSGQRVRGRRHPARHRCRHFSGTVLVGCARAGLGAVESGHRALINDGGRIGCSVNLDTCRKVAEPDAPRWDYILTLTFKNQPGLGVEVHSADSTEVQPMIAKKNWAANLLSQQCPDLEIKYWVWIIPPGSEVLFTRQSPQALELAEAGIEFPLPSIELTSG